MARVKKQTCSFSEMANLENREDADRLLIKKLPGVFSGFEVLIFPSRAALEGFNKKAGLTPIVFTQVPLNCAVWKHQSDSEARKKP